MRHTTSPTRGRFSLRTTNRRPLQVSSMAHTLLSTRPVGRNSSRMVSSVISVSTPELFFGHATQIAPSAGMWVIAVLNVRSMSDRQRANTIKISESVGLWRMSTSSGRGTEGCPEVVWRIQNRDGHPLLDPQFLGKRSAAVAAGQLRALSSVKRFSQPR